MTPTAHPGQIQVCGLCNEAKKLVRPVETPSGVVYVGRCTTCDARQCANKACNGYTADPFATACKHCKQRFESH